MNNKDILKIKEAWAPTKIGKPLKKELYIDVIDQVAGLFSPGSFYYYILNFDTLRMEYVDERVNSVLGLEISDWSLDKMFELMHPEDLKQMHIKEAKAVDFILNRIPTTDIKDYKVVYLLRMRHANGSYRTILQQSKALTFSEDNKVQQVLGIHTDVTYLNIPIDHKISFIGDKCPSYYSLPTDDAYKKIENTLQTLFTPREKEILTLISKGKTFGEIAVLLNVSPHTINTHKKNILKKTDSNNATELVARCIREGVI